MRRPPAAAALLSCALACRHAQKVPAPTPTPRKEAQPAIPPRPGHPSVAESPEGLLAPGAVLEIQKALAERGYLDAARSGKLDQPTSAAIRRFQEHEGLAATGVPDRETVKRLGLDPKRVYRTSEAGGGR